MHPQTYMDEKMTKLKRERDSAREHQERRHDDWNDNYELYRNKVRTNRLTQRQAVNLPLMKETVKTILSKIDDPPQVEWREKSSDEYKELIYQEIWNESYKKQKLDWVDLLDKKNVLMYGISTKFLNPTKTGVDIDVLDVYDVVFDPLMHPLDIESARFIIRQNIFRSLREILADERYSQKGKNALKMWLEQPEGMIQSGENKEEWEKKMDRAIAMGVEHKDFPHFAGGDVLVNLSEHYTLIWDSEKKAFERRVVVYADGWCELLDKPLKELIGVDEWPFVVWYEDPETNDIYPDGIADLVRTPNKVVNVWYSQLIENRTLSNFRMHWYDATNEAYTAQTYEPGPGRMLPAPGNPRETIQPVEISGLDESLTAIDYITKVVERGSGAVAVEKGTGEQGAQTLGEIEILVGKAMERSVSMQKFYRGSWYELCTKWNKLMHANAPRTMSLYRTGTSGKIYEKKVSPGDWKSEAGYEPIVSSTSEQEMNEIKTVQKFQYILQQFPENQALRKIAQRRQLELMDFTPDELKQVTEEQERMEEQVRAMSQTAPEQGTMNMPQPPMQQPQPQGPTPEQQAMAELNNTMASL
jgi:hypothetical protein